MPRPGRLVIADPRLGGDMELEPGGVPLRQAEDSQVRHDGGTYAGGVRWNGTSYVYEGHSYFYLTGQPKTLYVQYEATPYVKVDGKTYGPGQHDISSAKANCYVEYGDTGSRAGICILGV